MRGLWRLNFVANDKVGLSWRSELGLGILEQIQEIGVVEIVAENCLNLSSKELKAFGRMLPNTEIMVHALSLGLGSCFPVSNKHLDQVARVINSIAPMNWSEHLAFVRTDKVELGHLAAPPWSEESIEMTIKNIGAARLAIGTNPHLENIATLFHPLGSTMTEAEWTNQILARSSTNLLIDLENIYANSRNFELDPIEELLKFPLDKVEYVHIAGGHEAEDENGKYFLDDHLHPVSEMVFLMLEELAASVPGPLTVILERDGNYPAFEVIALELSSASMALRKGRQRQPPELSIIRQG